MSKSTTIKYEIPADGRFANSPDQVTLKIYDILGREVATLVNSNQAPGKYKLEFDASGLSSGVYYYRLSAGSFSQTRKMQFVK